MSASWPRPTLINDLSDIFITWIILIFYKVTLSKTINSFSGFSNSKISLYPGFFRSESNLELTLGSLILDEDIEIEYSEFKGIALYIVFEELK